MEKTTIKVEGMSCNHCVGRVKKAVAGVPGVKNVEVSLEEKAAAVEFDAPATLEQIKAAITDAGYDVV